MLKPGPTVTATADKSEAATPASRSAAATTSSMAALCASCARLGTTPPHGAWIASCDALASPSTRPSPVTTAAPVSSHEVSMPKMRVSAPRDTTRPSGPSRSGESGPEPNPVAAPVRPSMRARRSGLSGRTPPAANPRRWEGLGRNERRAAGRKPRAGADAGIDDARAPHVAVVTLTEARAARIAARIVFHRGGRGATANAPRGVPRKFTTSQLVFSRAAEPVWIKSTLTMPPVKKPPSRGPSPRSQRAASSDGSSVRPRRRRARPLRWPSSPRRARGKRGCNALERTTPTEVTRLNCIV